MIRKSGKYSSVDGSERSHKCGLLCLGPLTFHSQAVGSMISLCKGGHLAVRSESTFKNGLVFSNRQIKIDEKICLRVVQNMTGWHGSLRLGFTSMPPSDRSLPLPCFAIPSLTKTPGHWAAHVSDFLCQDDAELVFWVSKDGFVRVKTSSGLTYKLIGGVDLRQPLWAMIDVYGQTGGVFLLGSKKRKRRSCPVAKCHTTPHILPEIESSTALPKVEISEDHKNDSHCLVCMANRSSIFLPCGHRCLCEDCISKFLEYFKSCPLCRNRISAQSD